MGIFSLKMPSPSCAQYHLDQVSQNLACITLSWCCFPFDFQTLCGWTKFCSTFKPTRNPLFLDICVGELSFQDFLGGTFVLRYHFPSISRPYPQSRTRHERHVRLGDSRSRSKACCRPGPQPMTSRRWPTTMAPRRIRTNGRRYR